MTQPIQIQNIQIEEKHFNFSFIKSSGPGGQNINKVATAVQLKFDANSIFTDSPEYYARLKKICGRKINSDGIILIESKKYRTQNRNKTEAVERLVKLLKQAEAKPKKRKATKPTSASVEKRLHEKKRKSEKKELRRF